ncbi:transporter [Paenibacillus elgii]|uniref:Transporter n=1 Tax=Paenibacillus elgii TaxID=189691 RepID=A0A163SY45_9BACL|nr:DMT family transporter [Paenibacillus elgii]KZE70426.1 transporter [Paenibacillus elgii]
MKTTGLRLAYICAVLNAVIIGFSFLFTKQALESADPLDTLMFRFLLSAVVMSVPAAIGWVKLDYSNKRIKDVLLLAVFYPVAFFAFQAFGLVHAGSAEGGILYAFTPVITMLLASWFLKERTNAKQKLSIFLSVFGVVFVFVMNGRSIDVSNMNGLLLLFLSCVAFAGYSVMARSLSKRFSPWELSFVTTWLGFGAFLLISLGKHGMDGTLGKLFEPLGSGRFLVAIVYLGVLSSLVTSLLSNYVLSKMEASKMSVFSNLGTVVSIAAGALVLGETVTVYHLVGSVMIIAGVIGANRFGTKRPASGQPAAPGKSGEDPSRA